MAKKKSIEIKIDNILLNERKVFLLRAIDEDIEDKIVKVLHALDSINHKTIYFYLNSDGGSIPSGLNIINTMGTIKSPITTIITGEVCSMAALISVMGNKRLMYSNSIWMQHPAWGYVSEDDPNPFVYDRVKGMRLSDTITLDILKEYTNLTNADLERIKRGEVWLTAQECLDKGIVDKII